MNKSGINNSIRIKALLFSFIIMNSLGLISQTNAESLKLVQEFYSNHNGLSRSLDPSKVTNLLTDDFKKIQFTDSVQNLEQYKSSLDDLIEDVTLYPESIKFLKIIKTTVNIVESDYAIVICLISPKGKEGMDVWENHTFCLKKVDDVWKIQLLYINIIDVG